MGGSAGNIDLANAPRLEPGDIPLPPEGADGEAAALAASPKPRTVAALDFLDPASVTKTFTLEFPFRYEGREVREIVVRRLSVAEIGAILGGDGEVDLYDFYAAMTDLPKEVLRALRDEDVVFEGCSPFLLCIARKLFFAPTQETGGDTPSR